jgi:hypothetical protein
MTSGGWQQIEEIFHEALHRDPAHREAYLREACRGDSDLRREVLSLLANHEKSAETEPWASPTRRKATWVRGAMHSPGGA